MSDFKAKIHLYRFRLGLRPRPRWGSLLLDLRGHTSKDREGREGEGEGEGTEYGLDPVALLFLSPWRFLSGSCSPLRYFVGNATADAVAADRHFAVLLAHLHERVDRES